MLPRAEATVIEAQDSQIWGLIPLGSTWCLVAWESVPVRGGWSDDEWGQEGVKGWH